MRALQWVWLDLDDTLVDFTANSEDAQRYVYDRWQLSRYYNNVEEWLDSYRRVNHELWDLYGLGRITQPYLRIERFRRPLVEAGVPEAEAVRMSEAMDPAYLDVLAQGRRTIPGARELLTELRRRGYKIGVLSNGFAGVQQKKLASAGLAELVDLVVLSDDIGINKPDRRIYQHAMERSGISDPQAHLMIGDNPATDIAGAIAAGWSAILLRRHPALDPSVDAEAPYPVITSLSDVTVKLL